jgi:hypothetical protein
MSTLGVRPGAAGILSKWLLALVSAAAALVACGGDGAVGVGGTGAPPVGFGEGTITSLSVNIAAGSVYGLDGTGFDTSAATVEAERGPGDVGAAEVKLGQHVEIDFEVDRVAKAVRVEPLAVGRVSAVGTGAFMVLGQRVRINSNPAIGPVTVFEGYNSLADVGVGQLVEVHGLARLESDGVYAIQATRVEWLLTPDPAYARLAGVVTNLGPAGGTERTFCIGAQLIVVQSGTPVEADLQDLQNGWTVVVYGTPEYDPVYQRSVLRAEQVRIKRRINFGIDAYFGGTLTRLDAAAKTFELNGVQVRYANAVYNGPAAVEGQYLQMRGNFAVDGSFDATIVNVRSTAEVEDGLDIEGTITATNSATQVIAVQGYAIRVVAATEVRDCAGGLYPGLFVEVDARVVSGNIVADRVRCR